MIILDVREKEEFSAEYIPDSICCPLSEFDLLAPGILKNIKDSEILLMCRSGNRSKMALHELKKFNLDQHTFTVFEGGLDRWKNEGKTTSGSGALFPIMRQVQIVASTLIFVAFLGAKIIAPDFVYLALFVGFGLALSGFTGICPMVFLLQKMPWNNWQNKTSGKSSKNHGCC